MLRAELAAIDAACSRFRPDSEISRLHALGHRHRRWARCSRRPSPSRCGPPSRPTASSTRPSGTPSRALGYDRDFAELDPDGADPLPAPQAAPGWWRVGWDGATVVLPRGVALDLGATAKALSADRIATRAAERDRRRRAREPRRRRPRRPGPRPTDGWRIAVGDDHERRPRRPRARRQHHRGRPRHLQHHPPARGGAAAAPCTTSSTRAPATSPRRAGAPSRSPPATCVDANTASTAAVVLGDAAARLARRPPSPRPSRRPRRRRHHDRGLARGGEPLMEEIALVRQPGLRARLAAAAHRHRRAGLRARHPGEHRGAGSGSRCTRCTATCRCSRWCSWPCTSRRRSSTATCACSGSTPSSRSSSDYHPVWTGLGAVAFDLMIAVLVTSLLRARLSQRLWRRCTSPRTRCGRSR